MLWKNFLTRIFFGRSKTLSSNIGTLNTMPVNKSGLCLLNPVTSMNEKYLCFQHTSTDFIQAVTGEGAFYNANNLLALREVRCEG